jgi:hypothetical protein
MDTRKRGATTEMQVTSIRLEPELKERLREISGALGYQTLIREILWQFVDQQGSPDEVRCASSGLRPSLPSGTIPIWNPDSPKPNSSPRQVSASDIRVTFAAIAQREEQCALTGQTILPQQSMWLGLTVSGDLVPLSVSLANENFL